MCNEFYFRIPNENFDIYSVLNTSKENVLRNNSKIKFYAGEYVKVKINDYISHVVKPAETLTLISNQYNVDVNKIIKDNMLNNNKLFIGQILKIYKDDNSK